VTVGERRQTKPRPDPIPEPVPEPLRQEGFEVGAFTSFSPLYPLGRNGEVDVRDRQRLALIQAGGQQRRVL
jgi:hypothetical protein